MPSTTYDQDFTTTASLARFLATTGPEDIVVTKRTFMNRLLSRPQQQYHSNNKAQQSQAQNNKRPSAAAHHVKPRTKHIPLPVYMPPTEPAPAPSLPPAPAQQQQPTTTTTTTYPRVVQEAEAAAAAENDSLLQSFPMPPQICPNCRQKFIRENGGRKRRLSCPAAIHYTPSVAITLKKKDFTSQEAKALLSMIEQLQKQLLQEKQSRQQLERILAITQLPHDYQQ